MQDILNAHLKNLSFIEIGNGKLDTRQVKSPLATNVHYSRNLDKYISFQHPSSFRPPSGGGFPLILPAGINNTSDDNDTPTHKTNDKQPINFFHRFSFGLRPPVGRRARPGLSQYADKLNITKFKKTASVVMKYRVPISDERCFQAFVWSFEFAEGGAVNWQTTLNFTSAESHQIHRSHLQFEPTGGRLPVDFSTGALDYLLSQTYSRRRRQFNSFIELGVDRFKRILLDYHPFETVSYVRWIIKLNPGSFSMRAQLNDCWFVHHSLLFVSFVMPSVDLAAVGSPPPNERTASRVLGQDTDELQLPVGPPEIAIKSHVEPEDSIRVISFRLTLGDHSIVNIAVGISPVRGITVFKFHQIHFLTSSGFGPRIEAGSQLGLELMLGKNLISQLNATIAPLRGLNLLFEIFKGIGQVVKGPKRVDGTVKGELFLDNKIMRRGAVSQLVIHPRTSKIEGSQQPRCRSKPAAQDSRQEPLFSVRDCERVFSLRFSWIVGNDLNLHLLSCARNIDYPYPIRKRKMKLFSLRTPTAYDQTDLSVYTGQRFNQRAVGLIRNARS